MPVFCARGGIELALGDALDAQIGPDLAEGLALGKRLDARRS